MTPQEKARHRMAKLAKQRAKIAHTVNVVEIINGIPSQVYAWVDNGGGNKAAEKVFGRIMRENDAVDDRVIQNALSDGHYEYGDNCVVAIIHSN